MNISRIPDCNSCALADACEITRAFAKCVTDECSPIVVGCRNYMDEEEFRRTTGKYRKNTRTPIDDTEGVE